MAKELFVARTGGISKWLSSITGNWNSPIASKETDELKGGYEWLKTHYLCPRVKTFHNG